jgi:hypothetical protein
MRCRHMTFDGDLRMRTVPGSKIIEYRNQALIHVRFVQISALTVTGVVVWEPTISKSI